MSATLTPECPVEFLKPYHNSTCDSWETFLSVKQVNSLFELYNGREDFAPRQDREKMLAIAEQNARLIADGIGLQYSEGYLVLRHGNRVKRYRGASVERWTDLTESDRAFARNLMESR